MRNGVPIAILVAVVLAAALLIYPRLLTHRIDLTAYFQNANGLRAGAPVRLAGVEVGTVTSVRARPEAQPADAEVRMSLRTPYELRIPGDATVSLATAGVLGETFAEINVAGASAPPIKSGAVLKEKPTKLLSSEEFIEKVGEVFQSKPCTPQDKDVASATPNKSGKEARPAQ